MSSAAVNARRTPKLKDEKAASGGARPSPPVKKEDPLDAEPAADDPVLMEEEGDDETDNFFKRPDAPVRLSGFDNPKIGAGPLFLPSDDRDTLDLEQYDRFYLFQLPTKLPVAKPAALDEQMVLEGEGAKADEVQVAGEVDGFRSQLKDLESGRVGKLRVHASGRCSLLLGGCSFEVTEGMLAAFRQEVALVDTRDKPVKKEGSADEDDEDEEEEADDLPPALFYLGSITHKANVIPDYERLFEERERVKIAKHEEDAARGTIADPMEQQDSMTLV